MVSHLYVHIPFCPKVCPYCSFYKEASDRNKTQAFLDAVLRELDGFQARHGAVNPGTIFFGGGTPSALSLSQLEFLLSGLRARLDLRALKEWTLEMNPATVSLEKARLLKEHGVNRISMGVQSWDPDVLKTLGRVHSAEQAERSYSILHEAGFRNVNLDLMFAVPGQGPKVLEESLQRTIALQPEHISAYCLTYEEDTEFLRRFQSGRYSRSDEQEAAMFEQVMETLEDAGYAQYEISNYARRGFECVHNFAYWEGEDYLGLGPSAWSTIGAERWRNVPDTVEYIRRTASENDAVDSRETLSQRLKQMERLAFGIRTNRGVTFEDTTSYREELEPLVANGVLQREDSRYVLTRRGRLVADAVAEVFVA